MCLNLPGDREVNGSLFTCTLAFFELSTDVLSTAIVELTSSAVSDSELVDWLAPPVVVDSILN